MRVLVATAVLSSGGCANHLRPRPDGGQSAAGDGSALALLPTAVFAAIARGDTADLRGHLADEVRWVSGTSGAVLDKTRLLAAAGRTSPVVSLSYTVDSVLATLLAADVAVAEYRVTDRRTFRAYRPTFVSRASDVYVRRANRWVLLRHAQTWLVHPPDTLAPVDTAALRPFVGRYDRGAGYVDDVHFVDGYLVAQSTLEALLGLPGAHLWAVSSNTFSPEGSAPMIVFERDARGRVTGYVQQAPDGTIVRASRLEGPPSR